MEDFLATYNKIDKNSLELLRQIYAPQIVFIDPLHQIQGIDALSRYFENLYANIDQIAFDFASPLQVEKKGYVQWEMTFSHPKIKKGLPVMVNGTTFVEFGDDGKAVFHRDYFDVGAMIYQHLPLLGSAVRLVNRRLTT